jgi:DNA-binding LacI/PurR family transcriptional regulator
MSNILDVAQKAGVSPSTVARVINDNPRVLEETKTRVLQAMKALDYTPPPPQKRRGPKTISNMGFRTRIIAKLLIDMDETLLKNQFQIGPITQELDRYGLNVILVPMSDCENLPLIIDRKKIDGVIVLGKTPVGKAQKALEKIPAVWMMTRRSNQLAIDSVEPDNESNGRMAARYLIDRGHKHMAVFCMNPNYPAYRQRLNAFSETLEAAGCTCIQPSSAVFDSNPIFAQRPPNLALGEEQLKELFSHEKQPTALYILSNSLPLVYRVLEQRGLIPQQDVEIIVGDYYLEIAEQLSPPPTCIDCQFDEIARRTTEQLIWRIRNPKSPGPVRILLEPKIIEPNQ